VLDKDAIEDFKILVQKNSQALLEELDTWLTQNEVDAEDKNARYISLGIYYYENKDQG